MPENAMDSARMKFFIAFFRWERVAILVYNPGFYTAKRMALLLTFNCQPEVQTILSRINDAAKQTLTQKNEVDPLFGFGALRKDIESNRGCII